MTSTEPTARRRQTLAAVGSALLAPTAGCLDTVKSALVGDQTTTTTACGDAVVKTGGKATLEYRLLHGGNTGPITDFETLEVHVDGLRLEGAGDSCSAAVRELSTQVGLIEALAPNTPMPVTTDVAVPAGSYGAVAVNGSVTEAVLTDGTEADLSVEWPVVTEFDGSVTLQTGMKLTLYQHVVVSTAAGGYEMTADGYSILTES